MHNTLCFTLSSGQYPRGQSQARRSLEDHFALP